MTAKIFLTLSLCALSACSIFMKPKSFIERNLASVVPLDAITTHMLPYTFGNRTLNVRVGVKNPEGPIVGDVLYIHGFADRFDNHEPLFGAWTYEGLRVIAFDLPSHGEDSGSANDINKFDFQDLANLAAAVEQDTKPTDKASASRPLILAGWSTGGLVVVRTLQKDWTKGFSRPIRGAILITPGVATRTFPWTFGNGLGQVTADTLTHDPEPPHVGSMTIDSPFNPEMLKHFTGDLLLNSLLSKAEAYPRDIRTIVFTGSDVDDHYANSKKVREWVDQQNDRNRQDVNRDIVNISCPGAMHEMDNETNEYGGLEVRKTAAAFAHAVADGSVNQFLAEPTTFGEVCKRVDE